MMLTRKQRQAYDYIVGYVSASGVPPSYDEINVALGLHSKSGVHRILGGLEAKGYIRRIPNLARAIEIVREDERTDVLGFLDHATRGSVQREAQRLSCRPQQVVAQICRAFYFGNVQTPLVPHYQKQRMVAAVKSVLAAPPHNGSEDHQS